MALSPTTTLDQAKTWLRSRLDHGDSCPLCGQHAKMYRRKINAGMATSLISMHRIAPTGGWVHVHAIGARSREEGKLAYWGLVEEQNGVGIHGGRAGYWRVTDAGRAFLKGTKVPKYAKVYNGKCYGHEGDLVSIRDALGTKFNYDDLMRGI